MSRTLWTLGVSLALVVPIVSWNAVSGIESDGAVDEAAIRTVVDKYYHGVIDAEEVLLMDAWDVSKGHMKYVKSRGENDTITVVPISQAIEWWTRVKANTSSSRVLDVDIVDGKMASVKFEFIYNKLQYTEFLTLLKANGTWKIVSKAYVHKKLEG